MPIGPTPEILAEEFSKYGMAKASPPAEPPPKERGPNTSFHTAEFTQSEIEAARADIAKYNKDATPDQLAKLYADFDRATRADGFTVKVPLDENVAELYRDAGLSAEPKPGDYTVDLSLRRDLPAANQANAVGVLTRWAADIGFSKELGSSVIDRIIETGAQLSKMSADEQSAWVAKQSAMALKMVGGSQARLNQLREKAIAVLALAKPIDGAAGKENFSESLKGSLAFNDPLILSSLATHANLLRHVQTVKGQK